MSCRFLLRGLLLLTCFFSLAAWADSEQLKPISPKTASELYNPVENTVAGNPNGSVTLVEFFDYNCPNCRDFQPHLHKLIKKNPELRVVYKEYLLFGESSRPASQAAFAAQQQGKYMAMHNAMFQAQRPLHPAEILRLAKSVGINPEQLTREMQSAKVARQIEANENLVKIIKVEGAPMFIVTSSKVAHDPKLVKSTKQYIYMGTDGASAALQNMINDVKKG